MLSGCARTDDADFGVFRDYLEGITLQRTHLHHFPEKFLQQAQLEPVNIASSEVETAGTFNVNLCRGGGGQRAVP